MNARTLFLAVFEARRLGESRFYRRIATTRPPVFKTDCFNRSHIPPRLAKVYQGKGSVGRLPFGDIRNGNSDSLPAKTDTSADDRRMKARFMLVPFTTIPAWCYNDRGNPKRVSVRQSKAWLVRPEKACARERIKIRTL